MNELLRAWPILPRAWQNWHFSVFCTYTYFMNGSCWKAEIKGIERSHRVFIAMKNSTSSWLLWLRRPFSKPWFCWKSGLWQGLIYSKMGSIEAGVVCLWIKHWVLQIYAITSLGRCRMASGVLLKDTPKWLFPIQNIFEFVQKLIKSFILWNKFLSNINQYIILYQLP
jgi:hypothetical protein